MRCVIGLLIVRSLSGRIAEAVIVGAGMMWLLGSELLCVAACSPWEMWCCLACSQICVGRLTSQLRPM